MKCVSIFSVTLKSAITPSFMGFTATTFPGVRPSISLASRPTATTSPLFLLMATIEGSLTTIPLLRAKTRVLAVPRSIARSEENRLKTDRMLKPFFVTCYFPPEFARTPLRRRIKLLFLRLLGNHDFYRNDFSAAPAILTGDHDFVTAARHRLGEIAEMAVGRNVRHLFPVDDEGRAGLRSPADFHKIALELRPIHHKKHFHFFALGDERELERIARVTQIVLRVDRANSPEIIARIESGDVYARLGGFPLHHNVIETRRRAGLKIVLDGRGDRLPGKVNRVALRIGHDERRQIDRFHEIRRRQDV